ncbi:MGDG synthase family glycosyltransferase [Planococcus lenghuensis]|uniref:Galactosyldiacylglycerol synthase n=1 Tax=Planococcus lenghuensis TaxID=2213202 RepID=A0A1Q2L326_9BACL|nr:glycosyltransferase [Planococcus lenghuensis]AQQ54865.1 hypothetical protein B0X71_18330 [Planococcus lenghuensis]
MVQRVLILPIFQMPSGHHQVADTVADFIEEEFSEVYCRKRDLITYCGSGLETVVSKSYVKWIKHFPASYHYIYNQSMEKSSSDKSDNAFMKRISDYFERKMIELIAEEGPDVIICTHSFPSSILNRLKMKGLLVTPIINIYTDFFISSLWGKTHIDYHFVPNRACKELLVDEYGISENRVTITGIPIHPIFSKKTKQSGNERKRLLVAGGNIGLGNIEEFISKIHEDMALTVLCGKNEKLYKLLTSKNYKNIDVYPYISSTKKINELYDQADAIITKPGGITVSEALAKGLPIFTVHALPGQERENLEYLKQEQLICPLTEKEVVSGKLLQMLEDELLRAKFEKQIARYLSEIEMPTEQALKQVLSNLEPTEDRLVKPGLRRRNKQLTRKKTSKSK